MAKEPEVVKVTSKPEFADSILWDGSNTVKVLHFAGKDWSLIQEHEGSDVSGRTWTVEKHLTRRAGLLNAYVGDYLLKFTDGYVVALTPDEFHSTWEEAKK